MKTLFYTNPTEVFSEEDLEQLAISIIRDNRHRIFPSTILEVGVAAKVTKNQIDAFGFVYCTLSLSGNENFIEFSIIGVSISDKLPTEEEVQSTMQTFKNMHNAVNLN